VVVVIRTGKCEEKQDRRWWWCSGRESVKKNRAEDEDGVLCLKMCEEKQDRGWWQCQNERVREERKDRDNDNAVDGEVRVTGRKIVPTFCVQ
jgi:hypothetical protein